MAVVTGTVLDAGSNPVPGAAVLIQLLTSTGVPAISSTGASIVALRLAADGTGSWQASLPENDLITPSGTSYQITEANTAAYYIVVPAGAGPFAANTLRVSAPLLVGAPPPPGPTFGTEVSAPDFAVAGLPGAANSFRFVGGSSGGSPTTGTWRVGDHVDDQTGVIWICTTAGTPGIWEVCGGPSLIAASASTVNVASLSGVQTIDGVAGADGQRVLLTAQSTGSQNGLWIQHAAAWARPPEFASGAVLGGVQGGLLAIVQAGATNSGMWYSTTFSTTVDTTSSVWVKSGGGGIVLDTTATDIAPLGTQAAGAIGKAADAGHVHLLPAAIATNTAAIAALGSAASANKVAAGVVGVLDATDPTLTDVRPSTRWTAAKTAAYTPVTGEAVAVDVTGLAVPTGLTVTPTGTTGAVAYAYRVTALNSNGETLATAETTTATGNAALTGANYNALAWGAVAGAASYNVYGRKTTLPAPTGLTVTPTGTTGAVLYAYGVTALNANGETLASTEVTTSTGNAVLTGANYNALAWTAVPGATSYIVYGRTQTPQKLRLATVGTNSYNDTGAAVPSGTLPSVNTALGELLMTNVGTNSYNDTGAATPTTALPIANTSGDVVVTLPAGVANNRIRVACVAGSGLHKLTVAGNINSVINLVFPSPPLGFSADFVCLSVGLWTVASMGGAYPPLPTGASSATAFGFNAGLLSTSADGTAFGFNALAAANVGLGNTAIGANALQTNTLGTRNVAIGASAMVLNTTGLVNTAVGNGCMARNTSGIYNTAVGCDSLAFCTTGNYNTALGIDAMNALTTGSNNTGVGNNAVGVITTGNFNTGVGNNALLSVGAGNNNTAVGAQALANNTASGNIAVGQNCMAANTTGTPNTAVGLNALTSNTTGSNNVAMGDNTLTACLTGQYSTAVGSNALHAATASQNTAMGFNALSAATSGGFNVGVGVDALKGVTTGGSNTAVGTEAGMTPNGVAANKTIIGASNVFVGHQTGAGDTSDPSFAVAIGKNATVIGAGAVAIGCDSGGAGAAATVANQIKLGTANHALSVPGAAVMGKGVGFWGHAAPGAQPAAAVTLADVIAVLTGCGLTA
jgi:hypothetical protein